MKIIFTERYAKATGIKYIGFDDSCKVSRDKNDRTGVDSACVEYRGRTIGSYNNKVIETVKFEADKE